MSGNDYGPVEAVVSQIPACDFADLNHRDDPDRAATVDGLTTAGPWAYMCDGCHERHGVGLGAGRGQRLVTGGAS